MGAIIYYFGIPVFCLALLHILVSDRMWGSGPESSLRIAVLHFLLMALRLGMVLLIIFVIAFIYKRHFREEPQSPIFSHFLKEPSTDRRVHGRAGTLIL